ncbi:MAG: hypothetical protein ACKVZJ_01105 [Phycisphaerales bacterium]
MDLAIVRKIVNSSPNGVVIRMSDGTKYRLPHRDCVTLGPPLEDRSPDSPHFQTFVATDNDGFHFIDARNVAEIVPIVKRISKRSSASASRRKVTKKPPVRAAEKGRK